MTKSHPKKTNPNKPNFLLILAAFTLTIQSANALNLNLSATASDSRIDLRWDHKYPAYNIYRAQNPQGPFTKLNASPQKIALYSDFFGTNDTTFFYKITALNAQKRESAPTKPVSATSKPITTDQLITSVQKAAFQYFWDYGHPASGLARERKNSQNTCTSGGTGFGLMAIMVAADRKFVSRTEAADRILKIITFLDEKADRFRGVWSHWLNGQTGKAIPFSKFDDGGDLVETSYLIQGMLTVKQYFNAKNAVETEIRDRITKLWHQVEWDWYLQKPDSKTLYWHWSPKNGWKMNHKIGGHFNECMITYLLAIASPTHPIPAECYYQGWVGIPDDNYTNGKNFYGHKQFVGWDKGGPLFFTHYSFLGFDPRGKRDKYCNYFENNRNISLINRAYCKENPKNHKGYSELCWGLTASDTPGGYTAHQPNNDTGTITPTAAISAIVYTPAESIAAIKHFYYTHGERLWGEFGFKDAFNLDKDWYAESYLAIDQGPIVIMIENYRTALCWKMFMQNKEITQMLDAIGWKSD